MSELRGRVVSRKKGLDPKFLNRHVLRRAETGHGGELGLAHAWRNNGLARIAGSGNAAAAIKNVRLTYMMVRPRRGNADRYGADRFGNGTISTIAIHEAFAAPSFSTLP
jgi:hypothetical protein